MKLLIPQFLECTTRSISKVNGGNMDSVIKINFHICNFPMVSLLKLICLRTNLYVSLGSPFPHPLPQNLLPKKRNTSSCCLEFYSDVLLLGVKSPGMQKKVSIRIIGSCRSPFYDLLYHKTCAFLYIFLLS